MNTVISFTFPINDLNSKQSYYRKPQACRYKICMYMMSSDTSINLKTAHTNKNPLGGITT